MKRPRRRVATEAAIVDLVVSPEKVCFVAIKAREYDVKTEASDPDPGSNPADDKDVSVLEDLPDDPVAEEITALINDLSHDEQIDLVAIAWLGRGDNTIDDWPSVRAEAADAHNQHTANYLLGMPHLGDHLEEGLSILGHGCQEYEMRPAEIG